MDGQNFNNGYEQSGQQGQNGYVQSTNGQPPVYQQQGQNPYGQNPYNQNPYNNQSPYGQNVYGQNAYGQPYPQGMYGQPAYQQPGQISGLLIAGLVFGILGLVSSFILNWISALLALVGLVLSIIGQALKKSRLGVAAIILSVLGILAGVGFFILYLYITAHGGFMWLLMNL